MMRLSYLLYSCVVGFVFITGWFGIRFDAMKLLRLWCVALYATVVVAAVDSVVNGFAGIVRYYHVLAGNWFLNGYTLLMLVAPAVNFLVDAAAEKSVRSSEAARSALVLILVLVFGWAFSRTVPFLSRYVPASAGVEPYSGLTLVGIYTGARLVRVFNLDARLPARMRLAIGCVCLVAVACHLSSYASPFAFGLAMLGFMVFRNLRLGTWMSRLVLAIAPSMFAVFLLHANPVMNTKPTTHE